MKKEVNRYFNKKAYMGYSQIFLLIMGMFAFSYLIGDYFESSGEIGNLNKLENENSFSLFGRINSFKDLFNMNILGSVNAQEIDGCCENTKDGQICQVVGQSECQENFVPTNCESTDFCRIGCCVSSENGLCSERTSKTACENVGGIFKDDESCNVNECREGCCILGTESIWTTEINCQWEGNTQNNDLPTEWNTDISSELECLFLSEKNKEGACVYESGDEKKCILTSLDECFKRTGSETNFYEDKFCSDPELETVCKSKEKKECLPGEEDVYWMDSCGNKEDVAEDCDLYRGSYCGDGSCKDIRCDTNRDGIKDRENGESWCSYDAFIGDGKDTVGSRHVKHICYLGKERLAPCADHRNEICVQEDHNIEGELFSQAACRVNRWRECLNYNTKKSGVKEKCNQNIDCRLKSINMGGSFKFDVCLPNYPPGFDIQPDNLFNDDGTLNEEAYNTASPADAICDIGSLECIETWFCGIFGCWCVDNCDCHTSKFTKEMNDMCVSLGDCGAYINYLGDSSDFGYGVRSRGGGGPPWLSSAQFGFSKFADMTPTPAKPGEYSFFETINPELLQEAGGGSGELTSFEQELLGVSGAFGSPLLLEILKQGAKDENEIDGLNNLQSGSIGLSTYTGGISSAKTGIMAQLEGMGTKERKDNSMIGAMLAGVLGVVLGQLLGQIMGALIGGLIGLFFFGFVKRVHIFFDCFPWEAPPGGSKCNECNKVDVPCTEYRCESLGQACRLINKGTGNELCIAKEVDNTIPKIEPFMTAISKGYKYHNINNNGFEVVTEADEGCLEPYTPVDIGIKVSPFAKCRVGDSPEKGYKEMQEKLGPKGNYVLPAHLAKLFLPSPEAFKNAYNLSDQQVEEIGKVELYVKCQTEWGNVNPDPYVIKTCVKPGPDLTAPRIVLSNPETGTYLPFDATQQDIQIYVNEPSECKWSSEDKEFEAMENTISCIVNPHEYTLYGLPCNFTADVSSNSKFHIRCKDLSENSNIMSESYVIEFGESTSQLSISEVIPKIGESLTYGVEPATGTLKLKTQGGALDGIATCSWDGNGYGDRFSYQNNNGDIIHEYTLTSLSRGRYEISFACEDPAGNTAEASTNFIVKIDKFGPKITRAYHENGLKIVTSEFAECRQDSKRSFVFEEAPLMNTLDGKNHFGDWDARTYYVQCKDEYGNKGGRLKVRPSK
jgi:hypothetical protein